MDLFVNPAVDPSDLTPLSLGGVTFQVARPMLRQMVKIGPLIPDVLAILNRRSAALSSVRLKDDGGLAMTPEELADTMRELALSEPETLMLINFVYVGLTRAHPRLTRDDLLDMPILPHDLLMAADAIGNASGAVKKASTSGEAEAASQ